MSKDTLTVIIALFGAGTGLAGLALSIVNTWRLFDRDRVRLKVALFGNIVALPTGQMIHTLSVTVINSSYLPVTVQQIAFEKPPKHIRFTSECDSRNRLAPSSYRGHAQARIAGSRKAKPQIRDVALAEALTKLPSAD